MRRKKCSESIVSFFARVVNLIGTDAVFFISLAVEALFVIFFLVKSLFSYEASLNRSLEKLNYWLFDHKTVTEENIKDLNALFKAKAPKRVLYHWQQYILFREGPPSSYLSIENLVEKPLKTSSYNSNIKNLSLFSTVWAFVVAMFLFVANAGTGSQMLMSQPVIIALLVPILVMMIAVAFVAYLRARKNAILNSLYQNCALFGRFMDNACVDLPSYIDYQILFTPQEIEKGQPVLREFLDFKARKEKEEFNKARDESVNHEEYDFSSTGVDGSMVLDRAMKECETFLKKKEKVLLKISQLEGELDTRRKNFDAVQKDYQTKIQTSKENIERLRQMQEETTNRIESNYYRKQQTQEIGKQEQLEQEFEQQRTRYLLEKSEGEEEIAKLNAELDGNKKDVEFAMLSEYQTFFNKFCQSAEKVVETTFKDRLDAMKNESEQDKEYITQLEIKLKNKPENEDAEEEKGSYDENGNYVYADGTFYDKDGNYHDTAGNVYTQDGQLISKAEKQEEPKEKQVVNFDDFDDFDFMTDVSMRGDVYDVAEKVIEGVDDNIDVINNTQKADLFEGRKAPEAEEKKEDQKESDKEQEPQQNEEEPLSEEQTETFQVEEQEEEKVEPKEEAKSKKRGRPRKVTAEKAPTKKRGRPRKTAPAQEAKVETESKKKAGRPQKATTAKRGRPRKTPKAEETVEEPKRKAGRPRKTTATPNNAPKNKRGRPRKRPDKIQEINKKISEEEERLNELRSSLNKDIENVMNDINSNTVDDKSARRDALIKEIENLQKEAQEVISQENSEAKIAEINAKLENLLKEIKNLNL